MMQTAVPKRIALNALFLVAGKTLGIALQIIIAAILARYLGVSGYGQYSFAFAYLSFFQVFCNLGIDTILVREISRDRSAAPQLIGQGIILRLFFSAAAFFAAFLIITLLHYPHETTKAIYILSLTVLLGAFRTPGVVFQTYLESKYEVAIEIMTRVLTLGLVFLAVEWHKSLSFVIWMIVAAQAANLGAILLLSRKFVRPRFTFDPRAFRWLISESWPIALTGVFIIVYYKIDTIMLSLMKGDDAVGIYNAAYSVMGNLVFIPGAYATSIFPVLSGYFRASPDGFTKIFKRSFKYLFSLALPIVVGGAMLSNEIMLFLFGSRFASSGQVFRILIFATGIIFISNLVGPAITATNRQRVNMWITFGNMVLNIVLNLFLIPRWSYIGASVATVLTEGAGCALAIFFNMRYLKIPPLSMTYFSLVKPIAAVGVMAASILYFHALNIIAVIPIAAVCYGGALLFLGWFDKLDARLFRQAVGLK